MNYNRCAVFLPCNQEHHSHPTPISQYTLQSSIDPHSVFKISQNYPIISESSNKPFATSSRAFTSSRDNCSDFHCYSGNASPCTYGTLYRRAAYMRLHNFLVASMYYRQTRMYVFAEWTRNESTRECLKMRESARKRPRITRLAVLRG